MPAILIDYEKIVSENSKIHPKIKLPPKADKGFLVGLIIVTDKNTISDIVARKNRAEFINNPSFLNRIKNYTYTLYNSHKGVCLLNQDCVDDISDILEALFSGLPKETLLWVSIPIDEKHSIKKIQKLADNGFNSPYLTNLSPLRIGIPNSIAMVRHNTPTEQYDSNTTLNKVLHIMEEYRTGNAMCSLSAKLGKKAIKFLKQASKMGITTNGNGQKSQKELTGELVVKNVVRKNDDFVYVIDVDESSVESGEEENVNVNSTRYNFHSHPYEAYVRHGVEKAWPSVTDYLGFLKLGNNTIFHCVATMEGVYVMSFSTHWGKNLNNVDKKFVRNNYDIDHKEHYTPQQYCDKVNRIKYKQYPIYHVEFMPWNNAGKIFKVSYAKIGMGCIATEKTHKTYKKLSKLV